MINRSVPALLIAACLLAPTPAAAQESSPTLKRI
jgi:hypothetical protein